MTFFLTLSAQAFSLADFLRDQFESVDVDPVAEGWEDVLLRVAESVSDTYKGLSVDYLATRSFEDEFGGAITGDLLSVNVS